ncbi:hypothetical protein [Streptomyces sp. enrichment culture]|uniref:hypothetical protein n=1 Tax=Streptomyces sp. enrichment culture TaxID=1795815 RepID=UPI003F553378
MNTPEESGDGCGVCDAELIEIADGVYVWIQPDGMWWITKAGYVHGDEFGVLVDKPTTDRMATLSDAAAWPGRAVHTKA